LLSANLSQNYHTNPKPRIGRRQSFNKKRIVLIVFGALLLGGSLFSQSNKFMITGRFKIDGGSKSGAKIILEKDGRQVKSLDGEARFEIGLDYQAVYTVSFVKEGFVTKRLRFDTHVAQERIEYGFIPFDFTVEIFEQFDDMNVVVFNQPVGKIAFSDIIDEFDYDTDYTKSIQSQIDEVLDEVEEKKEEKAQKQAEELQKQEAVNKRVSNITSAAEKSASAGKLDEALDKYVEASKVKDSPEIQQKIKALEGQIEKKKQAEVEKAAAAKAAAESKAAEKAAKDAQASASAEAKAAAEAKAKADAETKAAADAKAAELAAKEAEAKTDLVSKESESSEKEAEEIAAAKARAAEQAKLDALAKQKLAQKNEERESINKLIDEGDQSFQANRLEQSKAKYNDVLAIEPNSDLSKKVSQIDGLLKQKALDAEKPKQAAQAIASGPKESTELASIIISEERKQENPLVGLTLQSAEAPVVNDSKTARVINGSSPVFSEERPGKAMVSSANLNEEDLYGGVQKEVASQNQKMSVETEQRVLREKYPTRKTIETEKAGTSLITYVYINQGDFVNVYKKVEHGWGGVFFFINERPINRRLWEHETQ
jgi:hypothetical protein